jgi:Arc/MetJ family transcription regulator
MHRLRSTSKIDHDLTKLLSSTHKKSFIHSKSCLFELSAKYRSMASNLEIDEQLIQEALELGNQQSERAVIEEALREYVQHRKQLKVLELFGTIDYEEDYDYKQQRQSQ